MSKRLFLASLATASLAVAQPLPPAGGQVQFVNYVPDQVVPLTVALSYAVLVELSPDERIDNVVVGDSSAWQVTPTRQGNQFVVKPISGSTTTDLIVSTSSRRYVFLLKPAEGSDGSTFVLRFEYPEPMPVLTAASPTPVRYRLRGDAALFPAEISGGGERTSIVWKAGSPLPAVFALDAEGHEALVNGRMVGQAYIVEGSSPRYIFRRDKAKAVATRENNKRDRR